MTKYDDWLANDGHHDLPECRDCHEPVDTESSVLCACFFCRFCEASVFPTGYPENVCDFCFDAVKVQPIIKVEGVSCSK